MLGKVSIFKIYPESFKVNYYTKHPFRMIGLIDVDIKYGETIERVTLPFYRSSGTNNGKIKGLWYPIVGLKIYSGDFHEFSPYVNEIFSKVTEGGRAKKGWLAKSLFFRNSENRYYPGFSGGKHYRKLLTIGRELRKLYKERDYEIVSYLHGKNYNKKIYSEEVYFGNKHSQKDNFERLIKDIYEGN